MSTFKWRKWNTHSGRHYQKTISIIFAASLFQVLRNQWPYPNNFRQHIDYAWYGEVTCNHGLWQRGTRGHPVSNIRALQAVHHNFRQQERVHAPKHRHSSPLEATLHRPEIKCGLFHELGTVPTFHITCKSYCKNMRTSMQRHNRCIRTSSIQKFCQNCGLQGSIGAEVAQHRNKDTAKCGPLPRPHHHPNPWAALLKFMLHCPCAFTQPNTQEKMRGYIPFKMID